MLSTRTALPCLVALASFAAPALQERVKKDGPADFPTLLTQASEAWKSESFGACDQTLKKALRLVGTKRRGAIRAAFPEAAEGWKRRDEEGDEAAMAMMAGITGTVVETDYSGPDGKNLSLQAMVDSPMVQMLSMQFANPAMLGKDAELIKYGDHKAILRTEGKKRYELTVVIGDNIVQANSRNMTDEEVLGMMSQSTIDALAAAMSR